MLNDIKRAARNVTTGDMIAGLALIVITAGIVWGLPLLALLLSPLP